MNLLLCQRISNLHWAIYPVEQKGNLWPFQIKVSVRTVLFHIYENVFSPNILVLYVSIMELR